MERKEHLKFCKTCVNHEMDINKGIVCSLTKEIADFDNECPSYKKDETVVVKPETEKKTESHEEALAMLTDQQVLDLKSEQDLGSAIIASLLIGVIGALLWGTITVITNYQIGYMAIAIGAGVGFSMRHFGKGIDQYFGITGGAIALFSCLLGNFFSLVGFSANSEDLGYLETFSMIDYTQLISIMTETFSPIDLLFYGIAAFQGYKFSFRTFTKEDLN